MVENKKKLNFRGARAGTCYSTTECSDKSGMASGNCASG